MEENTFLNPAKALAAAHLCEGMAVADFGAGSGFFTRAAARAVGEGGVIWAVDAHRELLPRLKNLALAEGLRNVEVMHGDIERTGGSHLQNAHFDLVMAVNVLFSAENKEALAQEVVRVLRRGGKALVIDWNGSHGGLGPHPSHIVTEASARRIFEDAGFAFVSNAKAGAYHWGVILKKR
ncbi:hypothetical protein A2852_01250 [Candidatus Adlerbacteria bacterium RIFCSPHIGHO2_01_FULL_54_23]|uniref:Methyltransferase domain-containing protein n=3 Tax=Candidatus Adleribacteriota TaxID=1752736 RepID=A0A1F4Y0I3_9BACT|nr:MAG: hypothetical protein UY83_C0006G0077 [Candidatus Adlerbacteria bacterium GW2011_GWA1_54_10]KKW37739.1 MAG: hypothetical protein UY86_C0004G0068 [Candidatus Adlerbacteria bacterium GW2011_GWB1_54_7]OGC79279.1 MAG: hypothetical protein A2852_01250 [Candidatus Adlerbacteria bacterium RIFCSPHIGHO2_01_FULL_54_23]OGC87296.1 MAG: hypothetical protein A3B33_00800 [Candidatus Adlerbacteria bacterium RIFCSPLOWO2_01_FULL_54_16]